MSYGAHRMNKYPNGLYGIMLKVYMTAPSRLNDIEYLSHGLQHGIMGGTRYADRRSVPTKHIQ